MAQVNRCAQISCVHGLESLTLSCRMHPCTLHTCTYVVPSLRPIEVMRMSMGATRGTRCTHVDAGTSVEQHAMDTGQWRCSEHPIGAPGAIYTKVFTFNSEVNFRQRTARPPTRRRVRPVPRPRSAGCYAGRTGGGRSHADLSRHACAPGPDYTKTFTFIASLSRPFLTVEAHRAPLRQSTWVPHGPRRCR